MKRAVAGAEREQGEGTSGKWVAHWKMVHIVRPVWEKAGQDNQMGRKFAPLTYTAADADGLFLLEPAPRTVRGARDLMSWHVDRAFVQAITDPIHRPGSSGPSVHARYSEATRRWMSHLVSLLLACGLG
jgi:malate synthase